MGPERDEDLELALSLHRELNGLTRRRPSRHPTRNSYEGALQQLAKKRREGEDKPTTTSSGSGSKRRSGDDDHTRLKKRKALRGSSSEGVSEDVSDPSSGQQASRPEQHEQHQQQDHHSSDRKASGRAPAPRSSQQADQAAQLGSSTAAAMQQARSKAAKAASSGPPSRVKCFFAGVRWGTLLPLGALKDRASLAAAVSKAFEQDGVRCSEASVHVIFVTADQQTVEFPGKHRNGDLPRLAEWDAAARRAVRIYVR